MPLVLETPEQQQHEIQQLGVYESYGLVFVTPNGQTTSTPSGGSGVTTQPAAMWIEAPPPLGLAP